MTRPAGRTRSGQDGFTLTEMLISTAIMLLITGAALETFRNGLVINDTAAQVNDANQNLRAGTNQLIRDLLMAGRIIGAEGIAMPTGNVTGFARPGPPGSSLTFSLVTDDVDITLNLPSVTTGYQLGPTINGSKTDIVTILTVDEFMPVITTPPKTASPTPVEGTISADGKSVTLPASSLWLLGDTTNDTPKIKKGDLVFYKGPYGNAIQTITSTDSTHIYFAGNDANDWFHFNQPAATNRPLAALKGTTSVSSAWDASHPVTLFRAMMITYYVDNSIVPPAAEAKPRLTRLLNHCPATDPGCPEFSPQALAGVVEDLDLTYDLIDGGTNPIEVTSLPFTATVGTVVTKYNSNQIRKVNVHIGVRSETISKPSQDYVRNHISTSVIVRSLASVDKYKTQ